MATNGDRRRLLNKNNLILGGIITLIVTILAWALTTYTSWATLGIQLSYKHEEKDLPSINARVDMIETRNRLCDDKWIQQTECIKDIKQDMKIQTGILKAWAKQNSVNLPAETLLDAHGHD